MPSESAEMVYLTGGRTSRTTHLDPECPRLARANKVVEKPASAVPEGFFAECDWCFERVSQNGRPLEGSDAE